MVMIWFWRKSVCKCLVCVNRTLLWTASVYLFRALEASYKRVDDPTNGIPYWTSFYKYALHTLVITYSLNVFLGVLTTKFAGFR